MTDNEDKKKEENEVEVLKIDEQCSIEFDKRGNIKIGDCKGKVINPGEIHLLDRLNAILGNH